MDDDISLITRLFLFFCGKESVKSVFLLLLFYGEFKILLKRIRILWVKWLVWLVGVFCFRMKEFLSLLEMLFKYWSIVWKCVVFEVVKNFKLVKCMDIV